MLSSTLSEGLKAYRIGEKLRALRLRKKLGLVELGKHTGLSPALLSKIERGRLFPTLPTLLRISLVFSVGLDFFFAAAREGPVLEVVRRKDRLRFSEKPGLEDPGYFFESLDFPAVERKLNAYYAEFQAGSAEKIRRHQHPGIEFLYVLKGKLGLMVGEDEHVLDERDSAYFDAGVPHGYRRVGKPLCAAIVVTLP